MAATAAASAVFLPHPPPPTSRSRRTLRFPSPPGRWQTLQDLGLDSRRRHPHRASRIELVPGGGRHDIALGLPAYSFSLLRRSPHTYPRSAISFSARRADTYSNDASATTFAFTENTDTALGYSGDPRLLNTPNLTPRGNELVLRETREMARPRLRAPLLLRVRGNRGMGGFIRQRPSF